MMKVHYSLLELSVVSIKLVIILRYFELLYVITPI